MTLITALDYAAVLVFALSGALAASRSQLDPVGFIFIATLTGVGGGTLRDLLLARGHVFWVERPEFIVISAAAAMVVFFPAHLLESRYRALLWLDALALGVAVPAGTGVALDLGQGPVIVLIMGMVTGCLGGLMRDVVCNEVPLALKQGELYVTAAFCGAGSALVALALGLPQPQSLVLAGIVTSALRAGSLVFGWSLPAYRARPPRR